MANTNGKAKDKATTPAPQVRTLPPEYFAPRPDDGASKPVKAAVQRSILRMAEYEAASRGLSLQEWIRATIAGAIPPATRRRFGDPVALLDPAGTDKGRQGTQRDPQGTDNPTPAQPLPPGAVNGSGEQATA